MHEAKQSYGLNRRGADRLFTLSLVLFVLITGWVLFQYATQGAFNGLLMLLAIIPIVFIGTIRKNLRRP